MDDQNKDGYSDSRESYGLKISELLKALAERKPQPCDTTCIDPRNITTTLSTLNNTGTSNTCQTFRSRAELPEDISQLSKCQFKRRDHLSESLPASAPVSILIPAGVSSFKTVVLAQLVKKSKMLPPSESVSSIREQLQKHEIHPHILGVQAWTKQQSSGPQMTPPKQISQTGPTNEWYFDD